MVERRPGRRGERWVWWLVTGLAGAAYVTALAGATTVALVLAPHVRRVIDSEQFRAALEAARHPVTEADLPRLLPGIPIYPGAKLDPLFRKQTTRSAGEGGTRVYLVSRASPSQIRDFYRTHMPGWELQPGDSERDPLAFRRGDEWCWVSIPPAAPVVPGLGRGRRFVIQYYAASASGPSAAPAAGRKLSPATRPSPRPPHQQRVGQ